MSPGRLQGPLGPDFANSLFTDFLVIEDVLTIEPKHNNAATDNYENFERFVKPPDWPNPVVMRLISE
jgi:hypothetical protein